jgi:hypothetical protein
MSIENLTELDVLNGIFTSIFVFVSIIVALKILTKYFEHKRKELITVGLAWIAISTPWWGNSFSFLLYILMGYRLDLVTYLFIENIFIPLGLIFWIYSFCTLGYPRLVKKMTILFCIICIPFELFLITMLIVNPQAIGSLEGMFDAHHTIISNLFRVFAILTVLITGILFSKISFKSEDLTVRWKGRFFLIGIVSFTMGALLDAILILDPIPLVIIRLLLISSSFEYYLGFFLPDRIAKILIRQK